MLIDGSLVKSGRLFQTVGPATAKARPPVRELSTLLYHASYMMADTDGFSITYMSTGIVVAVLNLTALVLHFCVDKFVVHGLPWDHAYIRDFVSFVIISITILVVAIPEGLPVAVMVSLAYSVKVRHSTVHTDSITDSTSVRSACSRSLLLFYVICV